MNFAAVFLLVASALLVNQCMSQYPGGADPSQQGPPGPPGPGFGAPGFGAPGFGAPGLGLGLPGLGLGLPGLGLGLPGLGLGLPGLFPPFIPPFLGGIFPRFGLFGGFGRFPFFPRRFGRSSEEFNATLAASQNRTVCSYVPTGSIIRCAGEQNLECDVETRFEEIRNITVRLPTLSLIPDMIKSKEGKEEGLFRLVSHITDSNFTMIHPKTNKDVLMSIYASPAINEPGFLVKDTKCFDKIENLVTVVGIEGVRFSLVVRA